MENSQITIPASISARLKEQEFEIFSLREMMNRLQEGIYITDNRGVTLYVNTAFLNLSGLKEEDLLGKRVHDLRDGRVLPTSCCARVIETKGPVSTINNYYHGQKCLVSGSPIFDHSGRLIRTIAIVRDVSELDAMMEHLGEEKIKRGKIEQHKASGNEEYTMPVSDEPSMQEIYKKAVNLAKLNSTILIEGETGTGKDYLALAIHNLNAHKKEGSLVRINCGAIPEHLIESELFGYEAGAFTGASPEGRKGLFEEAGEGTVFLDEIGDMPYILQVKLLNVLNDRQFYRVGGNRIIDFKARVIATTNADLGKLVQEKKFRADLYYRLNVFRLTLPPLSKRQKDITTLLSLFLKEFNRQYMSNHTYTPEAIFYLLNHPWPGNIRELKNFVEKSVVFSQGTAMTVNEVQLILAPEIPDFKDGENVKINKSASDEKSLKEKMFHFEAQILSQAIKEAPTLREAAINLEIDLSTLMRKKRKYGINQ
jgi:PAS domain S-box-containing protein